MALSALPSPKNPTIASKMEPSSASPPCVALPPLSAPSTVTRCAKNIISLDYINLRLRASRNISRERRAMNFLGRKMVMVSLRYISPPILMFQGHPLFPPLFFPSAVWIYAFGSPCWIHVGVLEGVFIMFLFDNAFESCILIVGFDHLVLLRCLRTLPRKTRNRRIGQPRKGLIHRRRMFLHRETDTCWEVIVVCGGIGLAGLIVLETVVC